MKGKLNKKSLPSGYEIVSNKNAGEIKSVDIKPMCKTVSVIMTFYNAERFIQQAAVSVLSQCTAPEAMEPVAIDFVIVDDKSQDKSADIVKGLIDAFNSSPQSGSVSSNITINYIEADKNLGCGGARKLGINNAVGDYIMFLDADDYYINRDFVARAANIMMREDIPIIEFGVRMNTEGQQPTNAVVQQAMKINNVNGSALIAMFADNIIKFNVWSKIYKRDIVMSRPYSTERTFEDVRTVPYWVNSAKEVLVMNTVEINYRAAGGSIIRNNIIDTRVGTITAIAEIFPDFKDSLPVMKAMYTRAMVDIIALCENHSEENEGFCQMSELNTRMLRYIYPDSWASLTFNPDVPEYYKEQKKHIDKKDVS